MDWSTRAVLSWRLSNTMDSDFCVQALEEALARYGKPEIFNTGQGSQFTSYAFTDVLKEAGEKSSMDGRGRCLDNVFIERLWRSLKYEKIYLVELETGLEARKEIGDWIIAKYPATLFNEPVRSWKKREKHGLIRGRSMMQVYISSKPAPLP